MAQEEILEDPKKEAQIQPKEELKKVNLGASLGTLKPFFISSQLSTQENEQLVELLNIYVDVSCRHMMRCLAWISGWWSILSMWIRESSQ